METIGWSIKLKDCPQCSNTTRHYHRIVDIASILIMQIHCMYCGCSSEEIVE